MTRYSKEHCKKNSNLSEQNSARYVGNLHKNASENVLQALFAVIGNVVDIKMINDAALSTSHYCFITYETHLGAQRALAAMNGRDVYKMPLKVNWATRPDGIKKDTSSKLTFIIYRFELAICRGSSHIRRRFSARTDDARLAKGI
jgi:RNA recognition motif-containing protein